MDEGFFWSNQTFSAKMSLGPPTLQGLVFSNCYRDNAQTNAGQLSTLLTATIR